MQHKTACPSEETLTDFLEHRLANPERERIERHLARCAACRELAAVSAVLFTAQPAQDSAPVPDWLTRRAVDTVLGLKDAGIIDKLVQTVRRRMAGGAAALERIVWGLAPAGVTVRGEDQTAASEVIHREKQFAGLAVAIDIEKSGAGQAVIRVAGKSLPQGRHPVRVALISREREIASASLGGTPVCFEEIPLGTYALVFLRNHEELGHYGFEMLDRP